MRKVLAAVLLYFGLATAALAQANCVVPAGGPATPVVSTSAESGHVVKASPGCLISLYVVNQTSTPGWVMVFNSTTVPADGSVTPIECVPIAASSYQFINFAPLPPEWFSTGISSTISSTGCFTKTAIASGGFFHALAQ